MVSKSATGIFGQNSRNAFCSWRPVWKGAFDQKMARYAGPGSSSCCSRPAADPSSGPLWQPIRLKKMTIRTIIEALHPSMFKDFVVTLPSIYCNETENTQNL